MKYKVQFEVWYETEVECDPKDLQDTLADLSIPEDSETKYVVDTFEVIRVEDEEGKEIV